MKKVLIITLCVIIVFTITAYAEEALPTSPPSSGFTVNLTELFLSVVALIFNIILAWLIKAVIPPIRRWLEAKTTVEQRQLLYSVIRELVNAAEQTIGAGQGRDKLNYVIKSLREKGFDVDLDMIESAVKEMNGSSLAKVISELQSEKESQIESIEVST